MPTQCTQEFVDQLMIEFDNANDRAIIIVGAIFLENYLEKYIGKYLPKSSSAYDKRVLFSEDTALTSFRTKIFWAYSTGIIGPKTQKDLDTIRQIKNMATHAMRAISFRDPAILEKCREINCCRDRGNGRIEIFNPREFYIHAIKTLIMAIVTKINDYDNADPLPEIMEN